MDPTPEQLQYLLGIHPEQVAANNALIDAAQGDSQGFVGNDENPMVDRTGRVHGSPVVRAGSEADNESEEKEAPLIAKPSSRGPRPITVTSPPVNPMGPPAPPEEAPPAPDLSAGGEKPNVSGLMPPSSPRPISVDQAREQADQQKLDEMRQRGSGVSRFQQRHHIFGPIVRGLDIAGSIVSPGAMAQIPGTTLNERQREGIQEERVKEDLGVEKEHAAEANREEVDTIRRQAEEDRRTQNEAVDKLRKDAETYKESMRDITYNPQTKQFMRGDQAYTPKDYQEGSMLEVQHGITTFDANGKILQAGPYTAMWEREKRNQQPQTHIHNPSAEEEIYQDWRASFKRENGRDPNAKEINDFRRGGKGGAGEKDYTTQRVAIEKKKNDELDKLERDFSRDWAKTETDDERNNLTAALTKNKQRVQSAYESELAQIPKGEQEPPERITGGHPQGNQPGAAKPQGEQVGTFNGKAIFKGQQVNVDGKTAYVTGWNPQTNKPRVSYTQPQQ